MIDVAEVATEIRHLISMGATERELVSLVVRYHPDLDRKAFLAALQMRRLRLKLLWLRGIDRHALEDRRPLDSPPAGGTGHGTEGTMTALPWWRIAQAAFALLQQHRECCRHDFCPVTPPKSGDRARPRAGRI